MAILSKQSFSSRPIYVFIPPYLPYITIWSRDDTT